VGQNNNNQVVRVNRLKAAHNHEPCMPKSERKFARKQPKKPVTRVNEEEEKEVRIGPFPLWKEIQPKDRTKRNFFQQVQCSGIYSELI